MRFILVFVLTVAFSVSALSQAKIDKALKKWNKESVPYITVDALSEMNHVLLFDAREWEEYEVSHLENAVWVGAKSFELDSIAAKYPDKSAEIVVYCSIGVRSENIGDKLQKAGYTQVKNLYGGIFKWKNEGYSVFNPNGQETDSIHAFSKQWGKLLTKGDKVY